MKKNSKVIDHWHVSVVVLVIFVISLVTWIQFAQTTKNILSGMDAENNEETRTSEKVDNTISNNINPDEMSSINKLFNVCSSLDDIIKKAGYRWKVYKNASLSKVDSLSSYIVLGEISSVQVIAGADKWLFYSSKTDGDPIGDFEGTTVYSRQEMDSIGQKALKTQEEVEKRGIKFAIVIAPNKENIYSEYMPKQYIHAKASRTDLLIDHLAEMGINIVSPKKELLDNHLEKQLYYYYDTHWNQLGAYIGVRDTLKTWGINMPELQQKNIKSKEFAGNYHYGATDDLALTAGLKDFFLDDVEYEIEGTIPMDWDLFQTEQDNGELSYFHNDEAYVAARIFLVGDSFRSAMVPILREQFTDVYVIHNAYYSADMIDYVKPDYLMVEYTERYSFDMKIIDSLIEPS